MVSIFLRFTLVRKSFFSLLKNYMFCSVSYHSNAQNLHIVLAKYHGYRFTSETKDQLGVCHVLLSRRNKIRFFRIRRNRIGIYFYSREDISHSFLRWEPQEGGRRKEEGANCNWKPFPPCCPQQSVPPLSLLVLDSAASSHMWRGPESSVLPPQTRIGKEAPLPRYLMFPALRSSLC